VTENEGLTPTVVQPSPGIEAAPAHETAAGMGSLSSFAVEKRVWVHTLLLLLFLASGATA